MLKLFKYVKVRHVVKVFMWPIKIIFFPLFLLHSTLTKYPPKSTAELLSLLGTIVLLQFTVILLIMAATGWLYK